MSKTSLVLGQYVPYNSPIHKLDARVKLIGLIFLMTSVFLSFNTWSMTFLMAGINVVVITILMILSHTNILNFLKSLKSLWFMAVFLLIIYILVPQAYDSENQLGIAFSIGDNFHVYWASILQSIKILIRLMSMMALTTVFSSTTKPLEMTDAFEWYLKPLAVIGFPAHEIAMILSISLRFIPTILEDVQRIMKAQASRGVDFKHGSFITKIKSIVSLIVPLFVSSFMRSEELADAMECRGYDPQATRTKYRISKFRWADLGAFIFTAIIFGCFIAVASTGYDIFSSWFGIKVF